MIYRRPNDSANVARVSEAHPGRFTRKLRGSRVRPLTMLARRGHKKGRRVGFSPPLFISTLQHPDVWKWWAEPPRLFRKLQLGCEPLSNTATVQASTRQVVRQVSPFRRSARSRSVGQPSAVRPPMCWIAATTEGRGLPFTTVTPPARAIRVTRPVLMPTGSRHAMRRAAVRPPAPAPPR